MGNVSSDTPVVHTYVSPVADVSRVDVNLPVLLLETFFRDVYCHSDTHTHTYTHAQNTKHATESREIRNGEKKSFDAIVSYRIGIKREFFPAASYHTAALTGGKTSSISQQYGHSRYHIRSEWASTRRQRIITAGDSHDMLAKTEKTQQKRRQAGTGRWGGEGGGGLQIASPSTTSYSARGSGLYVPCGLRKCAATHIFSYSSGERR